MKRPAWDYIDIDIHSHYGSFDEVWDGTIRVVKI